MRNFIVCTLYLIWSVWLSLEACYPEGIHSRKTCCRTVQPQLDCRTLAERCNGHQTHDKTRSLQSWNCQGREDCSCERALCLARTTISSTSCTRCLHHLITILCAVCCQREQNMSQFFRQKSLNRVGGVDWNIVVSLQWKSDESTKRYLTQMLLLTDGKNSHMRMKVQGRLVQESLIDIHQVFAKKGRIFF